MNEKVKLPRNVIDVFRPVLDSPDVAAWLNDYDNQWKLIDALRYGYEAESEPRWGIKAGHSYLYEPNDKSFGPDEEPFAYSLRERAEEVVATLGFGEVVDLNNEGKADD